FHVGETNVQVLADTILGNLAGDVGVQEVVGTDVHILTAHKQLVRSGHVLVEDFRRNRRQRRVGNPGTVVASTDLTQLVGTDALHGLVVGSGVVLDGDLSGHTTLRLLACFIGHKAKGGKFTMA